MGIGMVLGMDMALDMVLDMVKNFTRQEDGKERKLGMDANPSSINPVTMHLLFF